MVNELLWQILPFEMWKEPGMFYRYGERAVYLSRFPREVTLKRLVTLIVPEMSANGDWPQMHRLVRAKQMLYETMMRSSFLIEPELMHRLLGFGERLAALEHIKVAFNGDPHLCQEMAEGFGKVILQTLAIYEFLLQQADTRENREEYIQRVKAVLQDIHERYG